MAAQQQQQGNGHAVLPHWFEIFQDTVVLSFLVTAGAVLTGLMYTEGLVPNPEDPRTWGLWGTIKFVAFFIAGFGVAGVALRASAEMARSFRRGGFGGYFWGLVFLLISLLFGAIEIWANVTERSKTHTFTPADTWVLQAIGHPTMPVSPTVLALAVAQSAVLLVWGMVVGQRDVESEEERTARHAREEAEAVHKAKLAEYQGAGWGARIGAGFKAAKQQVTGDDTHGLDGTEPTGTDDPNPQVPSDDTHGYESASGQTGYGAKAPVSIKRGQWTSRQLKDYAKREYGAEVSDIEAANTMKVLSKGRKSGAAYVAPSRVVKAWVDQRYSAGNGDAEPTGTGER